MEKDFIDVIFLLNEDNTLSQRKIASRLSISLGKVNGIVNTLIDEGYIQKDVKKRKSIYTVSEKGIKLLGEDIKDKKSARIELHNVNYKTSINEAVILAAGQCTDFDIPVGLVEIDGEVLIDKTIRILNEYGISRITVVAGFMSELYVEHFKGNNNINLVINKDFKETGSMCSLDMAKDFIKDDFLLLECDVIFEKYIIGELINSHYQDCVILTNVSGFGDEVFVEIRDEHIFKISKDIRAFNKIDGELLGITKISKKMYDLMVKEYSYNLNPYTNYEYTLLDVAVTYKLGYVIFSDLLCGEVDTVEQLEKVKNYLIPQMKIKELKKQKLK
ncbi:MAG: NTP transferase domain-containing protein [Clostridium sp.]